MIYSYVAYNNKGEIIKGKINSDDEKAALKLIKNEGLIVSSIKGQKSSLKLGLSLFGKPNIKDKIVFTKELAIMSKAGLSIVDGLNSISEEIEKKKFKTIIQNVAQEVKGGQSLSKSMEKYPDIFPQLYVSVVKSGEQSGKLDSVLINLSNQMEKDYELIAKVKSAMTYPIVIFFTLLVVAAIILIYVIPQLEKVFNDTGVPLPILTRILLATSRAMVKFWWAFLSGLIGLTLFITRFITTKTGKRVFDYFKIKVPIFKNIFIKLYSARFARTANTLLTSGVPLNEIFQTTGQVINNSYYAEDLEKISEKIKAGKPLSASLENTKRFPHLVSSLIKVGEKSGKTDYVLDTLANYYEQEVDHATSNLSALIEPIIMLILGIAVALVVMSVIMPIYGLVNTI